MSALPKTLELLLQLDVRAVNERTMGEIIDTTEVLDPHAIRPSPARRAEAGLEVVCEVEPRERLRYPIESRQDRTRSWAPRPTCRMDTTNLYSEVAGRLAQPMVLPPHSVGWLKTQRRRVSEEDKRRRFRFPDLGSNTLPKRAGVGDLSRGTLFCELDKADAVPYLRSQIPQTEIAWNPVSFTSERCECQ